MKNNLTKIFDFLNTAGNLKKTLRYKSASKMPKESVADHSWRLTLMSFIIADELKLKLDIAKAMKIALAHDLAEAITDDIDALLIHNKKISEEVKEKAEDAAMKKMTAILPKPAAKEITKLWQEYLNQSSTEARYIYALDKLEAMTYLSETGHKTYGDKSHADFIPIYADKAVTDFKELKPVLKILKHKIKKEYKKGGLKWKKEYDKI